MATRLSALEARMADETTASMISELGVQLKQLHTEFEQSRTGLSTAVQTGQEQREIDREALGGRIDEVKAQLLVLAQSVEGAKSAAVCVSPSSLPRPSSLPLPPPPSSPPHTHLWIVCV